MEAESGQEIVEKLNVIEEKVKTTEMYLKSKKRITKKLKVDLKLVQSAVKGLQAFFKDTHKALKSLAEEEGGYIYINVCMSEVPLIATPRPHKIEIPHPIYGL